MIGQLYQCVGGPLDGDDVLAKVPGAFTLRVERDGGSYIAGVMLVGGTPYDVLLWAQDYQPEDTDG